MVRLFVYGTLLPGEANYGLAAPYVLGSFAGEVRGRLYDAGGYPGCVLDASGPTVEGVWLELKEEALPVLDELEQFFGAEEENDYERVWVRDARKPVEGWIYVWTDSRGLPEIAGGSWRKRGER
ncbi:MAG: gamma-glutamylcyclotransferase [Candidatus Reconcilbacillus cellulovorans]|uniref:Gamma-glutamylcyclotransferase n=1 Tax=Candidatus Reconcilbacillus cellulovorans TaxID=1906605 RepID=A0A2A6DYB3_9BACL|nr:MAG: gamma-glutamylcyclotransferase [Candidatus Reconcilbacillus cellulovorans]